MSQAMPYFKQLACAYRHVNLLAKRKHRIIYQNKLIVSIYNAMVLDVFLNILISWSYISQIKPARAMKFISP